jgi:hypothetical protein
LDAFVNCSLVVPKLGFLMMVSVLIMAVVVAGGDVDVSRPASVGWVERL